VVCDDLLHGSFFRCDRQFDALGAHLGPAQSLYPCLQPAGAIQSGLARICLRRDRQSGDEPSCARFYLEGRGPLGIEEGEGERETASEGAPGPNFALEEL
jgi:hypothetical protein